jgi:hypothetical protein
LLEHQHTLQGVYAFCSSNLDKLRAQAQEASRGVENWLEGSCTLRAWTRCDLVRNWMSHNVASGGMRGLHNRRLPVPTPTFYGPRQMDSVK